MKKFLLCISLLAATLGAKAHDYEVDGIFYKLNVDKKSVSVTFKGDDKESEKEYSGTVTIPESITVDSVTYAVTAIADYAFSYNNTLEEVIMPNTIKRFTGQGHFYYCRALKSVTLSESITSIPYDAFNYCTALTTITLPESLKEIGNRAFKMCSALEEITIPDAVTTIGDEAFANCVAIKHFDTGDGVKTIGANAFVTARNLSSLVLGKSVESIKRSAFKNTWLEKVVCRATTPPTLELYFENGVFEGTDFSTCTLEVPYDCEEAYKAADQWKDFTNITSGINTIGADDEEATPVYYNLNGVNVNTDDLTPGLYIVRKGAKVSKVVVK